MSEGRKQFTFYECYLLAMTKIKKPTERAMAYDTIVNYALYGIEPDMDKLSSAVVRCFLSIKPSLQRGRNMALARRRRINGN